MSGGICRDLATNLFHFATKMGEKTKSCIIHVTLHYELFEGLGFQSKLGAPCFFVPQYLEDKFKIICHKQQELFNKQNLYLQNFEGNLILKIPIIEKSFLNGYRLVGSF